MIKALAVRTCLGAIILFIGVYAVYTFILSKAFGAETALVVALVPTALMLLSIANLLGIWTDLMESSALKQSERLEVFQDGMRVAACGRIHPLNNQPVRSPLTRQPCVAYSYKVVYRGQEFTTTDYAGRRLIPSAVKTQNGDVRLLSWPGFRGFDQSAIDEVSPVEDAYKNIAEYICSTEFQITDTSGDKLRHRAMSVFRVLGEFLTDDDGDIRWEAANREGCGLAKITKESGRDIARFNPAYTESIANGLHSRSIEEVCVRDGEEVCLIGIWSALKRGIVSDSAKGAMPVLIRGRKRDVERYLRFHMAKRLVWGVVLASIANLGIWIVMKLAV